MPVPTYLATQKNMMSSRKKFLTNQFGDEYLYEINQHDFNQIGATALFRKTFADTFAAADTFYIVAGTDSGLLVKYIVEAGIPEGSRFLFVELAKVINQLDPALWESNGRITVCSLDEWQEKATQIGLQSYLFVDRVQTVRSVAVLDARHPAYIELFSQLQMEFNHQQYLARASLGSKIFVQRHLETLADNLVPARQMQGWGKGKSCVLLAGGPSLDDILPWLKQHRDRFIVIAVSRIARRLQQEQLTPDIWCSIDPWAANLEVSKEMLAQHENTLLVHAYHIYAPLIGQWAGKSLYLGERFPWESALNGNNIAVAPIQVTNSALAIAIVMEFSEIILAGVDFCLRRDGYSHARGSLDYQAGPQLSLMETHIETNDGHRADTTYSLASAAAVFERLAEPAKQKGIIIINPAPGAAKLKNIRHFPLDDITLPQPLNQDHKQFYKRATSLQGEEYLHHQRETLQELSRMLIELKTIRDLSSKALKCHRAICSPNLSDEVKSGHKKRMDRIEKRLSNKHAAASRFIKGYGIHSFLKMGIVDRDRTWSDADVQYVGKVYYESYRDTAEKLIKLISTAQRRVHSRIDEQSKTPDFPALFKQWQQDAQPGRSLVWMQQHRKLLEQQPKPFIKQFYGLEKIFQTTLENASNVKGFSDGTSYLDRLKKRQNKLAEIFPKLNQLFQQRDEQGMAIIISGLKKIDSEKSRWLATIACGYHAEIQGRLDDALDHYLQIVQNKPLLQILLRISDISLQREDHETATMALEVLSEISPSFMPSYANILRLTGQQAEALKIYHHYLDQTPDDLATVITLGKFYLELNVPDAATDAFNYVLKRDSDNQAARILLESAGSNRAGVATAQ